jgi:3-phosphoshikimate 1-carboxyvinyltransferase
VTVAEELVVVGPRPLRGRLRMPGDKGISHRALIAAALAHGPSRITNLAPGDDVDRTAAALQDMGVGIDTKGDTATVQGRGVESLHAPPAAIDCGNSGTTMRMLTGLVAGRPFVTELTGDDSLSSRPMERVIQPLRELGADIKGHDDDRYPPLTIRGGPLRGQRVGLAVASGQVKTALILAGMQASGETEIVEPAASRDHTERLFGALGVPIERRDERTTGVRSGAPSPFEMDVPGDPSSAAFFIVAALVTPGSDLVLTDVLLNPIRTEFIDALRAMGAQIEMTDRGERLGEAIGDIEVSSAPLRGTTIGCHEGIIDEVPALAVAAAFAEGDTEIRGAAELRVKESDRIATLEQELTQLGIVVEPRPDGLLVRGGNPRPATLKSHGDHRIAMAAAVAANAIEGESRVRGWQAVAVSYPSFADDLETVTTS